MRARNQGVRREHQVNIRLTTEELADLQRIGLREDRDRSYLVAWFCRWGIHHYDKVGSLLELQSAQISAPATQREIMKFAEERLKLRKEAKEKYGAKSDSGTSKKSAIR